MATRNVEIFRQREEMVPRCLTVRLPGVPLLGEFFAFGSGWIAAQMVKIMEMAIANPIPVVSFAKAALGIAPARSVITKVSQPRIFDLLAKNVPAGTFEVKIPGVFDIIKIGIAPVLTPAVFTAQVRLDSANSGIEAIVDTFDSFDEFKKAEAEALAAGFQRDNQLDRLLLERDRAATQMKFARLDAEREERKLQIEQIDKSPTPESSRQKAAMLTSVDNVQDDIATLAAVMHIIQFLVGRRIPGIGQAALFADMLSLAQAGARVKPRNFRVAGKGKGAIKKEMKRVSNGKFGTQANRIETANRAGKLGIGMSDIVQGLQSLEQHSGYGLRLGPLFGAITDLYYGFLRGADITFSGPAWDPFNFSRIGCTRSPGLEDVATGASSVCHFAALRIWDYGSRLLECPDCLTDTSRRRVLWGLAYAMECLYPWLIGQDWESDLANFKDEPVVGVFPRDSRSEDVWDVFAPKGDWRSTHLTGDPDRVISREEWVQGGFSKLGDLLLENINLVKDSDERELLETALVGSTWSLLAGLNPAGVITETVLSSSTLEDLAAMDGDPGASQRLESLLSVSGVIAKSPEPS